ncbi:MAG: metallophosphoesterase family protein [Candidatus Omnitrophica bacterium]|nr:metallophosphoesterase family protein [Candidatus Omnitrophota bacterium]
MRYGIFADVHSNLEALDAVIEAYKNEAIDRYLCVGDLVGYAVNPRECIKKVKALAAATVAGNHDWASVGLFSFENFNPLAKEALFWTKTRLDEEERSHLESLKLVYKNQDLTLVHGTLDNPAGFGYMSNGYIAEETFRILETNICFIGHTHCPGVFIKNPAEGIVSRQEESLDIEPGNSYIINVGSVGQPRDGDPRAAYCIYDTARKRIQIKRVDYDAQATRKKIVDLGLPEFLGDRFILGR